MSIVSLGIGSNLGDRKGNCLKARDLLEEAGIDVLASSRLYETPPWGVADQPAFMNMALRGDTCLSPADLLKVLKSIEFRMGRTQTLRWGPRIIDIDILLYDDVIFSSDDLHIPHPLMAEREFVLKPLAEIAGGVVHPLYRKTIAELLQRLQEWACSDRS